jgi:hypothetical protein
MHLDIAGGFLPGDLALECEDSGGEESWQLPTGKLFPQTLGVSGTRF